MISFNTLSANITLFAAAASVLFSCGSEGKATETVKEAAATSTLAIEKPQLTFGERYH